MPSKSHPRNVTTQWPFNFIMQNAKKKRITGGEREKKENPWKLEVTVSINCFGNSISSESCIK